MFTLTAAATARPVSTAANRVVASRRAARVGNVASSSTTFARATISRARGAVALTRAADEEGAPATTSADDVEDIPPWERRELEKKAAMEKGGLPWPAYLGLAAIVAIASVGSCFELTYSNPIFGVVYPDSFMYKPILYWLIFTGFPLAAFLWSKGIDGCQREPRSSRISSTGTKPVAHEGVDGARATKETRAATRVSNTIRRDVFTQSRETTTSRHRTRRPPIGWRESIYFRHSIVCRRRVRARAAPHHSTCGRGDDCRPSEVREHRAANRARYHHPEYVHAHLYGGTRVCRVLPRRRQCRGNAVPATVDVVTMAKRLSEMAAAATTAAGSPSTAPVGIEPATSATSADLRRRRDREHRRRRTRRR